MEEKMRYRYKNTPPCKYLLQGRGNRLTLKSNPDFKQPKLELERKKRLTEFRTCFDLRGSSHGDATFIHLRT